MRQSQETFYLNRHVHAIPRVGRKAGAMGETDAIPRVGRKAGAMGETDAIPRGGRKAGAMSETDAIPRVGRKAGAMSETDAIPRVGRKAGAMGEKHHDIRRDYEVAGGCRARTVHHVPGEGRGEHRKNRDKRELIVKKFAHVDGLLK